jgi:hypothetical protein
MKTEKEVCLVLKVDNKYYLKDVDSKGAILLSSSIFDAKRFYEAEAIYNFLKSDMKFFDIDVQINTVLIKKPVKHIIKHLGDVSITFVDEFNEEQSWYIEEYINTYGKFDFERQY